MTIVHSKAPWGQPQEERLAPKERTHPMRPLSCNNNTTTRLKRGPNPLFGVLILVLIFFVFFLYFVFLYFFLSFLMFYLFIYFLYFVCLFVCLFYYYLLFFSLFLCCFFLNLFFIIFFTSALICFPPGDNHNRPSSPQATERS